MKITIDTKEDSHDEIKRIISMLSQLVGQEQAEIMTNDTGLTTSHSDEGSPEPGANMFNMFGMDLSSEKSEVQSEKSDASHSHLDEIKKESDDNDDATTEISIEPKEDTSNSEDGEKKVDLGIPQLEEYDD